MGYNTHFDGELKFAAEPTLKQVAFLKGMLGEDCRDHPEWEPVGDASYIDLVLLDDFSGIKWDDGTEKTYGLVNAVNIITREMRKQWPDFKLTGAILAQGDYIDDRWMLSIDDEGIAHKQEVRITGQKITCPHCNRTFRQEQIG